MGRVRLALVLVVVAAAALGGCIKTFEEENLLRIAGIDVAAPKVSSGAVTLAVNTTLDNSAGASGPVRVVVKAYDMASSLLVRTGELSLGPLPKDRTVPAEVRVEVPRTSGYRIDVLVYEQDRIVQDGHVTVSNLAGLPPNLFETGLHIGAMDFTVRNVSAGRVAIEAGVYVTNEGAAASKALRMQVKAREVSTGLVADDAWVDVAALQPEATRLVSANLSVPDAYNYAVEAVVWDGDVLAERGQGNVQLLPTFTKSAQQDLVVTHPNISDFSRDNAALRGRTEAGAAKTPGFEAALAALALAGLALIVRRRH